MPFELTHRVLESEIDELQHVNNAVYVQYIEKVSRAHPESVGLDTEGFLALGGLFVVRRHEIDYLAPAVAGDELTIRTWIGTMQGPRAERFVEILRGEELLVKSRAEWVWIDPTTRRPKRVPPVIEQKLAEPSTQAR